MFNNFFKNTTKKQWVKIGIVVGLILVFVVVKGVKTHYDNVEFEKEYSDDDTAGFESIQEKADEGYSSIQAEIDSESESIDKENSSGIGNSKKSKVSKNNKSSQTSESASSINATESLNNLKSIISMPMAKENYQNLENGLLEAAKIDDISGGATQSDFTRFHSKLDNINDRADDAKSLYSDGKDDLDSNDQIKLKTYKTELVNYLNRLHDYAVIYQNDNPVINTPDTSADVVEENKQELQDAQEAFTNAKDTWSNSYDSIMNS